MDQAWQIEQEFWQAFREGDPGRFYARHMTADGFVVLPGAVLDREDLVGRWKQRGPLDEYGLSEPKLVLVDGESCLVSYKVTARSDWLDDYRAQITSLYTWSGNTWALAFRQHTPDPAEPFPF